MSDKLRATAGLDFRLPNDDLVGFIRAYDFAPLAGFLGPGIGTLREQVLRSVTDGWSIRELARALAWTLGWSMSVAQLVAQTETIRSANASALASYVAAGVELKVWIADSEPCSACSALDKRVVPIDRAFPLSYVGGGGPLPILYGPWRVFYPPAHPGCRCAIGAEVA